MMTTMFIAEDYNISPSNLEYERIKLEKKIYLFQKRACCQFLDKGFCLLNVMMWHFDQNLIDCVLTWFVRCEVSHLSLVRLLTMMTWQSIVI